MSKHSFYALPLTVSLFPGYLFTLVRGGPNRAGSRLSLGYWRPALAKRTLTKCLRRYPESSQWWKSLIRSKATSILQNKFSLLNLF
jgi:hypothetical protein